MEQKALKVLKGELAKLEVGLVCGIDKSGKVIWAIHGPAAGVLGSVEQMKIEIALQNVQAMIQRPMISPAPEKKIKVVS